MYLYSFKVRNESGNEYDISGDKNIEIVKISGLTPVSAEISTSESQGYDGSIFSSSRTGNRNIVIELQPIKGDIRQKLYKYFTPKKTVRLYFEDEKKVYIDGYVESFEGDIFEWGYKLQISAICPNPYFIENENPEHELTFKESQAVFEFPFEVDTVTKGIEFSVGSTDGLSVKIEGGEVESGIIFYITFNGFYSKSANIVIENTFSGDKIIVKNNGYWGNNKGRIYINSYDGDKQAYFIYTSGDKFGETVNIISDLQIIGNWVKLLPGNNVLKIYNESESTQKYTAYCHTNKYFIGV